MDFYEKALFVKPTWRLPRGQVQRLWVPFARYASIRTVSESPLGEAVHMMRSVFSDY